MRPLRSVALIVLALCLGAGGAIAAGHSEPAHGLNEIDAPNPGAQQGDHLPPATWDGDGSAPDTTWRPTTETGRDRLPEWLEEAIRKYGPVSVFFVFAGSAVGIHVNEDMVLIPSGFLAAGDPQHSVRLFWQFALFAYLGIIVGDAGWFWLCRVFGTRLLHSRWFKRLLHPRRLLEVKHQIDVRGAFVLIAARFIPGTRIPVITMCGIMHMPWWKFLAVEFSCVMITVSMQLSIGWFAAKAAESAGVTKLSHQIGIALAVTLAVAVTMYLIHVWLRSRSRKHRTPRAAAKWLRIYTVNGNGTTRLSVTS
ncbi:MAG: DedA family protein [Phycisphaeraceae bacterium]|nr:DedA family protein [Phycisphaeraceae bacterium]